MEELLEMMKAVESYHVELTNMMNQFAKDVSMLLLEVAENETSRTNY